MKATIFAALALLGLAIATVGTANAAVMKDSVLLDGTATVSGNGRAIAVSGQLECDTPGERVSVTVSTVSQTTAVGKTALVCDADAQPQTFELTVRMRGNGPRFSAGQSVLLLAGAYTHDGSQDLSPNQPVTLVQ